MKLKLGQIVRLKHDFPDHELANIGIIHDARTIWFEDNADQRLEIVDFEKRNQDHEWTRPKEIIIGKNDAITCVYCKFIDRTGHEDRMYEWWFRPYMLEHIGRVVGERL